MYASKWGALEIKKRILVTIGIILIVGLGIYIYQIPYQKHVAQQALYQLLSQEYSLSREEIHINNTIKDIKSRRGGVVIDFTVENSLLHYTYDYSLQRGHWIRAYEIGGMKYYTNEIIFVDE